MHRIMSALALSLWAPLATAYTTATYFDLSFRESRYLGGVQNASQEHSYSIFSGDLNLETQSSGFNYRFNPVFMGALQARDEVYVGVPEVYVQPRKIAPGFNLTIGRVKRHWSRLDEEFNLGVWQPQLRWDYLQPMQEGLTGVFFDWSLSSAVRFSFFTSPLYVPDQGPQFRLQNGQFSSSNRWFVQPTTRLGLFQDSEAPLYFEIAKVKVEDILMHSSFGFSMNYQSGGPIWSQVSYAFKPRNQIHLGIECANCGMIKTAEGSPLEVTAVIHPRIVSHNVLTLETGFDRIDDRGWVSLTGDIPQPSGFPAAYAEAQLNNLLIAGFAYQHYMRPWIGVPSWLEYSYMRVFEFRRASDGGLVPDDEVHSSLDRYPYSELAAVEWRLLLKQGRGDRLHWRNRYSYSFPERGGWLSSSIEWARGPLTWSLGADVLGAGADPASREAGLFSQYRANDRVFGGLSYVF